MSRTVKIILGAIAVLILLCCGASAAVMYVVPTVATTALDGAVAESPEEAAAIGQSIIDYTLPAGYEEQQAMDILFKMVMIAPVNHEPQEDMFIMLMEFPAVVDEQEMREQMENSAAEQTGAGVSNAESTTSEQIVINDQNVTLTTIMGTNEEGQEMQQMIAPFTTKDGSAGMLMIIGSQENWDGDAAGTFISSLQ